MVVLSVMIAARGMGQEILMALEQVDIGRVPYCFERDSLISNSPDLSQKILDS